MVPPLLKGAGEKGREKLQRRTIQEALESQETEREQDQVNNELKKRNLMKQQVMEDWSWRKEITGLRRILQVARDRNGYEMLAVSGQAEKCKIRG